MDEKISKLMDTNKELLKKFLKKPIQSEKENRRNILTLARMQGCEGEAKKILEKYDRLLLGCSNEIEKKHIAMNGIAELHNLLNVQGQLIINGVEVLPPKKKIIL